MENLVQIKTSQKTRQKVALNRLVSRGLILTLVELLLLILILSSCKKEENNMRTAIVSANSTVTSAALFDSAEAEVILSAVNRCKIKRIVATFSPEAFNDNSMTVKAVNLRVDMQQQFFSPDAASVPYGSWQYGVIFLESGQQMFCEIDVPANFLIQLSCKVMLVAAGTSDFDFNCTFAIDYEELE